MTALLPQDASSRQAPAESPASIPPALPSDDRGARRWGWLLLLLGVGGFFTWAAVAPLDEGVPAPGSVLVSSHRKTVQPLQLGLIDAILVKEGDQVQRGQLLVRLDSTRAASDLEIAQGQLLVDRITEARLLAEQGGKDAMASPQELLGDKTDPRGIQAVELQMQLFKSRRANLAAELGSMRESIAGIQIQIAALQDSVAAREEQRRLLEQELHGQRQLADEGFLPRNRVSEQERLLAQIVAQLAQDRGNMGQLHKQVAELKLRIAQRQQEYQKDVESQLTDVQREVGALEERIRALQFELNNTQIRSPADGMVVGLSVFTVGGVVQAGQALMDIVPINEPLRVDAQIAPNLIDRVHVGLPVDLMFVNFNASTTPRIPGVVKMVGADVLTDKDAKQSFYRVQVEVTPQGMSKLGENKVMPGMPVQVFIRTGERTLLTYILKPFRDRMHSALTER
jgi:protease secretion system membrane fusion protein